MGAEAARVWSIAWQLSAVAKRSTECGPHLSFSAWNSSAEAVVPHCRHVRKVVGPHVQLPQHTLEREQESALDMGSEEVSRACSERSSDPQETSSLNLLQPTANGGNKPRVMNRQPRLFWPIHHHLVMFSGVLPREGARGHDEVQNAHSSLRVELSSRTSGGNSDAVMNSISRRARSTRLSLSADMPGGAIWRRARTLDEAAASCPSTETTAPAPVL